MTSVGDYELTELIGRGSSGEVWRARRSRPVLREVAIKLAHLGEDHVVALAEEAQLLASLDHPHIIRVLDVVALPGSTALPAATALPGSRDGVAVITQLARGGSLADLLAERRSLAAGEAVALLAPVADALASAHRQGVVHGDLKPANVVLSSDGEPLLSDFGLAVRLPSGTATHPKAGEAGVVGSLAYLDPAASDRSNPPGRASDTYALGVMAYEVLAGRLPHPGDDPDAVLAAARAGDHPDLSTVSAVGEDLAALVRSLLDPDPARRPGDLVEVARRLRASVPAGAIELPGPAQRPGPGTGRVASREGAGTGSGEGQARRTRAFGPRPPAPEAAAAGSGTRWEAIVALVALCLVGAAVAWWQLRPERADPGTVAVARPVPRGEPCSPVETPSAPEGARELAADLTGDGCPTTVVWDGQVMTLRLPDEEAARRYDFKRQLSPGDQRADGTLLVGDWDCDGQDSPALYDPGSGTVFYFGELPDEGQLLAEDEDRANPTDAEARVTHDGPDGCEQVTVRQTA